MCNEIRISAWVNLDELVTNNAIGNHDEWMVDSIHFQIWENYLDLAIGAQVTILKTMIFDQYAFINLLPFT